MQNLEISVEVHCIRPPWAINSLNEEFKTSYYRLYIDNDLITERTWRWDNNVFLLEHVWVESQDSYEIRLEPVLTIPQQAEFKLENAKISEEEYQYDIVDTCCIKISK